ncbi:hypothetical protein [Streptomyces rhizosphaericus]|uniref:hypothetical protein n=1 Tax=Streptomyces rhizosphaericus TaxID=114699 RepID=UPI003642F4AC
MDNIVPEQARTALDAADRARRQVAEEVGLPRGYWWAMAAGWILLGVLGNVLPPWLAGVATVGFGVGHGVLAPRLLDGRRRTDRLQVSAAVAGRRTPWWWSACCSGSSGSPSWWRSPSTPTAPAMPVSGRRC